MLKVSQHLKFIGWDAWQLPTNAKSLVYMQMSKFESMVFYIVAVQVIRRVAYKVLSIPVFMYIN